MSYLRKRAFLKLFLVLIIMVPLLVSINIDRLAYALSLTWTTTDTADTDIKPNYPATIGTGDASLTINGTQTTINGTVTATNGDIDSVNNRLKMEYAPSTNSSYSEYILTFSKPVANLSFSVFDIDSSPNNWSENITFNGYLRGTLLNLNASNFSLGSHVRYISGNTVGTDNSGPLVNTDPTGAATVTFPSPVNEIRIRHTEALTGLGQRLVYIFSNMSWQEIPDLSVTKTTTTTNVNAGGQATYNITVTNNGTSQANGVTITDNPASSGFTYNSTGTVILNGGSTRPSIVNPTVGSNPMTLGNFNIPVGGSVIVPVTMNVATNVTNGIYNNSVSLSSSTTSVITNYAGTSSNGEDVTVTQLDYGDAPDVYKTLEASGGAKHNTANANTIFLGTNATDTEANGFPGTNADGDDNSATDDEDSVTSFPSLLTTSTTYSLNVRVTNTTGSTANLRGWIDFNKNNAFDAGESVATTVATGTNGGTATLTWNGLSGLVAGQSYVRLRYTTDTLANTDVAGAKTNGEVEDYPISIQGFDYGDAPDTYKTLDASSGAKHNASNNTSIFLGTNATDSEANGIPGINADGDDTSANDDEDSVTTFPNLLTSNTTYSLNVRVTNTTGSTANLRGWIDFNGNDLFDSGESVATTVATGTNGGTATLTWNGLTGLVAGQSYVRLRYTTDTINSNEPTGTKSNGEVEDYPLTIQAFDYGDAPNSYGTLNASSGAKHDTSIINSSLLFLGTNATDVDANGIPGVNADGDDNSATDDEDSITTFPIINTSSTAYSLSIRVTNNTGSTANLGGWIDFNGNGAFNTGEYASTTVTTGTSGGTATLTWNGLSGLVAGQSYVRLRYTTNALANTDATGTKTNGEVEDYPLTIQALDYGDAPDVYKTLEASGGAKHIAINNNLIFLGTNATDTEINGLPNTNADGDDTSATDDEDSISSFPALLTTSNNYSLNVRVTNNTGSTANLAGWIDFNKNNTFDTGEYTSTTVATGTSGGAATLTWNALASKGLTAGQSYIRLRFTTDNLPNTDFSGLKNNGEVEDYPLTIQAFDYGDAPDTYKTLEASGGAKHNAANANTIFLGTNATDIDVNGTPTTDADGDDTSANDDEDSITSFPSLLTTSTTYSLNVRVTNTTGSTANLRGWIDFNGNNAFDSTESASTTVTTGTNSGNATLTWTGLSGLSAGQRYLRLRFTTDALANTDVAGAKTNGEVEDYPITILGPKNISGTIFEDINYGGGAGRNLTSSSGVGVPSATVELYSVASGVATYISSTTTGTTAPNIGKYTFANRNPGNYLVRVVNSTVTSTRPGTVNTLRGVQTFRTNASTGSVVDVTDYVGGQNPQVVDANAGVTGSTINTSTSLFTAGTGLTGNAAQSITNINLTGANDITGVDFGFNFDTIVNTNSSGQGSLDQFIANSNFLDNTGLSQVGQSSGQEVSIFMIPNGVANPGQNTTYTNQLSTYGAAKITMNSFNVNAPNTSIDGRTQTKNVRAASGQETNSGQIGSGGFVGVSQTRLNRFDNPEIELIGNNDANRYTSTSNATGFELRSIAFVQEGVLVSGSNSLVQDNVIGMQANGTEINSTYSAAYCLEVGAGTNDMIVRHNYVKCNNSGIRRDTDGSELLVEYNEVDRPAVEQTATYEAFLIIGAGQNDTAQYNLFKNMRGAGSELGYNPGAQVFNLVITENTYTGNGKNLNGTPSDEPLGIIVRTIATNSVVNISKNIISNNGGTGILVQDTNRVRISQNSIFENGPAGSQYGSTANLGIDLRTGNNVDPNSMATNIDGVTPNNGTILSTEANNGTDYPIITSALIKGTTIKVQGYVGNAPGQTAFANSILEFFLADDDGNNKGQIFAGDGKNVAHGEGKIYLDSCNTNTTNGNFNCTFYNVRNVTPGTFLTSTATNQNNDTSEFSNLTVVQEQDFLFYPDNAMNALPGDTVSYAHELIASEPGNVQLNSVSNKGWVYTFFRDVNGNSLLDAGDTPYTGGMNPSLGNVYSANSTHSVKIITQVFIPSNTPMNTVDSLVITATLTPTDTNISPKTLSVTDLTTVSNQQSGALKLIKSVDKSSAKPNENVTYTIRFTNNGNSSLNTIKVEDQVPANTTFISAGFVSGTTGTITSPSVGGTGKITWNITGSLPPGSTGTVTFVVKVDP